MLIETKYFGALEVAEDKVITFPQGLFAFEEKKRYILLENQDRENPLWWLQSLDDSNLAFVLINPFLFKPDYEFELSAEDVKELSLENPQEAAVFCITVIPQEVKKMTVNLLAPLVINAKLKKGKQIVLLQKNYTTKHLVLEEMQKAKQNRRGEGRHHVSSD
jgi:flagellar assembly factor FliW